MRDSTIFRRSRTKTIDLASRAGLKIDVSNLANSWEALPHDRACMRMHPRSRKPDAATGELCETNERTFRRSSSSSYSSVVINDVSSVPGAGNKRELLAALTHPKLIILDDPDEAPLYRRITRPGHFINRRIVAHPAHVELPVRTVRPTNGLISRSSPCRRSCDTSCKFTRDSTNLLFIRVQLTARSNVDKLIVKTPCFLKR